jgi:hypothetical protein|tara:strand:- start:5849 stop:6454 length:606 start_codon:yes stop_codon:yes gene_type:complete
MEERRKRKMPDVDIFQSLEQDAKSQKEIPNDEKFKQLNTLAKRFIDTKDDISVAEENVSKLKESLKQIKENDLPDMMSSLNMDQFKLTDGTVIAIKDDVFTSIKADKNVEALQWLDDNGLGDIIKHKISISFNRGDHEDAEKFKEMFNGSFKQELDEKSTVHPQTLKATVKEMVNNGQTLPDTLFNVYEAKIANVKIPKGE